MSFKNRRYITKVDISMKAIILAAGLGSRLNELTSTKPKALVEVNGITMLEHVINKLKKLGITKMLINIHHFGDSIIQFLQSKNYFDIDIIISDERSELLNTGGAILKAEDFIYGTEPVIVHNVDILSDLDIISMLNYHKLERNIATLAVRERKTSRLLVFDKSNQLVGWRNNATGDTKWVIQKTETIHQLAFSGIYIIDPEFVKKINQKGNFSIVDTWLILAENERIGAYIDTSNTWHDLGTIDKIKNAENKLDKHD